jgi:alkanesulfonate monooxygenase SsuD/methylene tetrahydromethanopterin reductase-like flavin-dependent oxidoreductase (luciferase family)
MITSEQLDNWFAHHAPVADQSTRYARIRDAAREFARVIVEHTPEGADQTAAIRKLREVVFTANASIACHGPM